MNPETVPVRTTEDWERETVDGELRVTIQRPQQPQNRLDRALFRLVGGPSERELDLDAVGSVVWLNCDGTTTVPELGHVLDESFSDERVAPIDETLSYFLAQLAELELIRYERYEC